MKGNKIAIDRYLETGEVVDSLDLSVNYLVKSTREGGTVPLPAINVITWSKVTTNPSPSDLMTTTNTDTSIDFDTITAPSGYPYIYKIQGNLYTTVADRGSTTPDSIKYIVECSLPFATSIGKIAFNNCSSLVSINLPRVTTVGDHAFRDCSSLVSINLPNATSINWYAFNNCSSLVSINLPNLTTVERYVFENCSSLVSINLPRVTTVMSYAFNKCPSLTTMTIGTNTNQVATLDSSAIPTAFTSNIKSIYVLYSLVDSYKSATNWSNFADKIKPALGEIQSLSITADDVWSGRITVTNVYYIATYLILGTAETITVSGQGLSEPFPQNTSTTDSVTREIFFTKDGLTATTTITQGVWRDSHVETDLSPGVTSYGWTNTDVVAPEGYDIYMSDNYHVGSSQAVCKLTFRDYIECDIYIRSYGEGNYDYTIASTVNASSYPTDYSSSTTFVHTRGNQKSGTTLADYTKVSYTGLNDGDYVYIVYRKDNGADQGDDRGYVLIPQ